ncbi:MAG TPA: hypothetical protein VGE09_06455 [Pseudoxanthomonas sp.]
MGVAHTRAQRRWGMAPSQPPTREPDIVLSVWVDAKCHAEWTHTGWPAGPCTDLTHNERAMVLFDAAWVVADDRGPDGACQPAIWMALDQAGGLTWFAHKDITTRTGREHAAWLVRWWWRITVKWARLAWRCARGRG